MNITTEFPYETTREDVYIPLSDGTRLYARIWRPLTDEPVPALLEYLPYRLSDWTAPRDWQRHPWYAGHGYASVRVDVRGHGNSEGLPGDEYDARELEDGVAVIHWLAQQEWCSGRVGMFGISWGGFNSLQIAALAPEPLKAIVTVCSTDDRYDNDVHYMGGSVLAVDMHAWAATMLAFVCRPPDPAQVGDDWREMWLKRLEAVDPFIHTWLAHQSRDDYWKHGSVCEDYGAIKAKVLAVGGWHDPYRDTVLRLVEHLDPEQVRGLIGPWSHQYPDRGLPPGPAIGFLQETLRWWDQHLKGQETGVMREPLLRSWISGSHPPATVYETLPGRWVGDASWPSENVSPVAYALQGGERIVASPQQTGVDAGRFFPFGNDADLPPDQRDEDAKSVSFEFPVAEAPIEILGRPRVKLRLRMDVPRGQAVARLCDVAPDGSSTLVTRGVLNLAARHGRDRTDDWPPARPRTWSSTSTASGTPSRPATASGSPSPPPTGPGSGRRPARPASPWTRTAASSNSRYAATPRIRRSPSANRSSPNRSAWSTRSPWRSRARNASSSAMSPRANGAWRSTPATAAHGSTPTASNSPRTPWRRTPSSRTTRSPRGPAPTGGSGCTARRWPGTWRSRPAPRSPPTTRTSSPPTR